MPIDPLTAGLELADTIVDKVFPDAGEEQKRQLAVILGQLEINKTEAAHPNWFIAGWRPAIGWICALALFYAFVGYPLLLWSVAFFPTFNPPKLVQSDMLFELMFGMLGLGAMRSWERSKGVQNEEVRFKKKKADPVTDQPEVGA